jgi:hypothetical protein
MNETTEYETAVASLEAALASLKANPNQDSTAMYETLRHAYQAAHSIDWLAHVRRINEEGLRDLSTPTEEF